MRGCGLLLLLFASTGPAAVLDGFRPPSTAELELVFRPLRAEQLALAPDARHLAYTVRESRWLSLIVLDLDHPTERVVRPVGEDWGAGLGARRVGLTARITFLRWATANRLIYATLLPAEPGDERPTRTEVHAIDADGRNARALVRAGELQETWFPGDPEGGAPVLVPLQTRVVGLDPDRPGSVFVETSGGPSGEVRLYQVDVLTGARTSVFLQPRAGRLFYDRQCRPRLQVSKALVVGALAHLGTSTVLQEMNRPLLTGGPERPEPPRLGLPSVQYRDPADAARWRDFDAVVGATGLSCRAQPENRYGERTVPLAFDRDPRVLYVLSNAKRDTVGLYALDLATGRRADFVREDPARDLAEPDGGGGGGPLVFDRANRLVGLRRPGWPGETEWFDPELARRQDEVAALFPGRSASLLEWDDARQSFLVSVAADNDPGRLFLYRAGRADGLMEILRRAPWQSADAMPAVQPIAFDTPAGVRLTGTFVTPRRARLAPPPLVVYCRDLPGRPPGRGLNPDLHALARLGFAVVQVNTRGSAGLGRRHCEAIRAGWDRVPLEDVRATVAWLAARKLVNPRRVAMLGYGFGGYLAGRAVALWPDEFRCAVGINAPTDLDRWLNEDPRVNGWRMPDPERLARRAFFDASPEALAPISLVGGRPRVRRPVLILQDAAKGGLAESHGRRWRDEVRAQGGEAEYRVVPGDFSRGEPAARAEVFAQIGGFLNEHVLDYQVELGETKEVP